MDQLFLLLLIIIYFLKGQKNPHVTSYWEKKPKKSNENFYFFLNVHLSILSIVFSVWPQSEITGTPGTAALVFRSGKSVETFYGSETAFSTAIQHFQPPHSPFDPHARSRRRWPTNFLFYFFLKFKIFWVGEKKKLSGVCARCLGSCGTAPRRREENGRRVTS